MSAVAIGNEYGRWTVIGRGAPDTGPARRWLCRCVCGAEREVLERSLRHGGSFSCGCLRRERAGKAVSRDLTGQVFASLTVLSRAQKAAPNGGLRWLCRCACGREIECSATQLFSGKKTHCGCRTEKRYAFRNVAGQRFGRLTALHPTAKRTPGGSVIWHCRCDCGNETEISYNELCYTDTLSCGCLRKEHNQALHTHLTHVAGTSVDILKSRKLPRDNTTGVKGVYFIRGRHVAKIVFQQKQYYLGAYKTLEEAAQARQEAEEVLAHGTVAHYEKWKARAESDLDWAKDHPIAIHVYRSASGRMAVSFLPEMGE